MKKVILASHGDLSKGMLHSVSMIVGDLAKQVETYSLYPGETPNDYYEKLKLEISTSTDRYVIVCDVKGGSVHTTLSKLMEFGNVTILSGMNMSMVLDLLLNQKEKLETSDYLDLIQNAKNGMSVVSKDFIEVREDEEF
ncbi:MULTISPECIES: PTS sugar transporter subunit IIA [unclassified Breznakia]|uniref:PTS sugar transporter subunit IIA n=1 Tax=unclassified Breznakia TaxID=2623764 RepID=UPI0024759388|nr:MULTISPECIES: PTS sugar transporter subunit IIA [unclassified Breznakia]MDH6366650.1 mannose/fructose-specific phosphotransferase system component IIA [Breznakia sp. PH1-1]MDH6403743.1 mannose/fructose-specific phosphotransferase system component IIA [Breznakia sp. PF1-11]MDH6411452.1 mannose/fructose-specific phosphotransferase system component IIA [Breznakia sp. PFB1-11]MDH6413817.1 mannose/fructose-specific phosphotransferase system component IIA [Breznakia sp. PFB1-14]MDH6416247.1 manno